MSGAAERPAVPHNRLTFGEAEARAAAEAVASGQWAGGPRVQALERGLSGRAGRAHAVGVASRAGRAPPRLEGARCGTG